MRDSPGMVEHGLASARTPPRGRTARDRLSRVTNVRTLGLLALLGAGGGLVAYMTVRVPLVVPLADGSSLVFSPGAPSPLSRAEATRYWVAALVALLLVLAVDGLVVALAKRRRRRPAPSGETRGADPTSPPGPLRLERVSPRAVAIAVGASVAVMTAALVAAYPLWVAALAGLVPLLPLYCLEAVSKYRRYPLWTILGTIVLLQIGHMGEHTVQVGQLLATDGHLARSHGVFGQLDFELVHFVWDTAVWLSVCLLLYHLGSRSRWLVVAFVAASLHEVEHVYLFWLYMFHYRFYMEGGLEGILGYGGVLGSPLARPYLHFAYNLLVVVPMTLAFWDYTRKRSTGGRGVASRAHR